MTLVRLGAKLRALLFGTLRRQIVVGVALVAALTMALFMWNLTLGLRALVLDRQAAISEGLAISLAESAAGALAASDTAGLQRLVEAQRHLPQVQFSMLIDRQARVLAHTDRAQIGQTVRGLPAVAAPATLNQSAVLFDVVAPVVVEGRHVGWARVGLAQRAFAAGLTEVTRGAFAYALIAIFASTLIAAFVATRLTRRLRVIHAVASAVEQGDLAQRAALQGTDEAAQLGRSVDLMLDALAASREALAESERRFRMALDAASMEAWHWDVATDTSTWGTDKQRLLGPCPAEGYPDFRSMVVPQDREMFLAAGRAAMAGVDAYQVGYRLQRTDGELRWLVNSGRVIRDASGKATAMVGVTQDVTERRQAEVALAESRRLLSDLIENSGSVIFVKDLNGAYEFVNRKWEEAAGFSRDQVIGRTNFELFSPHIAAGFLRNDLKVLAAGHAIESEEVLDNGAGRHVFLTTKFPVRDTQEQIRGICGMGTEITERKRDELRLQASEARLQAILDAVPECVKLIGPDGNLMQMNAAGLTMVEAPQDPTPLLGCSVEGLVAEQNRAAFAALTHRVLAGESGELEFEIIGLRGTHRWMETRAVPLRDDEAGTVSMLAVSRDISERKAMQAELMHHRDNLQKLVDERTAELNTSRLEAERLGLAKSEFLAHMSHEIRTPLNAVLGLTRIGKGQSQGSPSHATFERIDEAGKHLLAVINDILDFSRLEASRVDVEQRAFSLANALATAGDVVAEAAQQKGLALEIVSASELPEWVTGDVRRVQQVLINLLSNAVKFTSRGKVSLHVARREGDVVEFKIIDTGIGMTAAQVLRLFRPFEQADSSTTRRYGGSGLGLVISRSLARLMGGDIEAQSAPDLGSTFTLRLPLPAAARAAPPDDPGSADPVRPRRLAGLHLLAAEDVEVNRLILEAMLTQEGARVQFAENGQQALDCVARDGAAAYDAVLMDLQMPVMDGYVATRELGRLAPGLPVIGLTAHALADERAKSLAAGMVDYVTKPIDIEALVSAIQRQAGGGWASRHL